MNKYRNSAKFLIGLLSLVIIISIPKISVAQVRILSDSRHAYNSITSTINQLVGAGHLGTDFIVDSTNMNSTFVINPSYALNENNNYYNHLGVLASSSAPYHIFTTSATHYPGDTVSRYNLYLDDDLTYNYAFSNTPAMPSTNLPPTFHIAPGFQLSGSWGYGVEWCLDVSYFTAGASHLSGTTATNAGALAVLRYFHPEWNWYDIKAVMRQNSDNWNTGYNKNDCGFGVIGQAGYANASSSDDTDILLQPPAVTSSYDTDGRVQFTIYPFRQSRRVKEVLFKFNTLPVFHANELTLDEIEILGGEKITESTTDEAGIFPSTLDGYDNDYLVWLTADNVNDEDASFSRIDTYSILGPFTQDSIEFFSSLDTNEVVCDDVCAATTTTFSWTAIEGRQGIDKYQLFIDDELDHDDISGTSTTIAGEINAGAHTWYIKAFNGAGVSTSSITRNFNIISDSLFPTVASNPSPIDLAVDQKTTLLSLSWNKGDYATSHNVYFGTDPDNLDLIGNQISSTYLPNSIENETTYYWRVDEINYLGVATGTVWSFTTKSPTVTSGGSSGGGGGSSNRNNDRENVKHGPLNLNNRVKTREELLVQISELKQLLEQLKAKNVTNSGYQPITKSESIVYTSQFNRTLGLGMNGEDVLSLQKILNKVGFRISESGVGSLGNETTYFGIKTQIALQVFQCETFALCSGSPESNGHGMFGPTTKAYLLKALSQHQL